MRTVRGDDSKITFGIDKILPSELFLSHKRYFISKGFESLDYEVGENRIVVNEEQERGSKYLVQKSLANWAMFFLIGLLTAIGASIVDMTISSLCHSKFVMLIQYLEIYESHSGYIPIMLWILLNVGPFMVGVISVTYIAPMAAGSGIPFIKAYLNGVNIPDVLTLKTLVVKSCGLAASIVGGVASGKEGPMIHVGAGIASIVSQGTIRLGPNKRDLWRYFRNDKEKRDMISAGAASGVAAAFGASVGGVLFSLEEGSSFWNQMLTWRMFFSTVISKFTVNLIMSFYNGKPGELDHPSLINLGNFEGVKYKIYEIPIFATVGVLGGLLGALFNFINSKINEVRYKWIYKYRYVKVLDAALIAMISAIIAYLMVIFMEDCTERTVPANRMSSSIGCKKKGVEMNNMVSLWLQTPQMASNSLMHDELHTYKIQTLVVVFVVNYGLSVFTFGLSSSNGIFVPSLLTGACWGRLLCALAVKAFPTAEFLEPKKYALIAAAANLGGVIRMTLSLTVILMETSNNITFSLPIIITLMLAKWTGDFFNDGIYNINIRVKSFPFLTPDPPPLCSKVVATDIMNSPVHCFRGIETTKFVLKTLKTTTHNGFPIVDGPSVSEPRKGKIKGLVLRSQIIMILVNRWFSETIDGWLPKLTAEILRAQSIERLETLNLKNLELTNKESHYSIDFRPFMTSPYTLDEYCSLPRIYRLFRGLGIRHLPIVNDSNEVVGMVTRKDIAQFTSAFHKLRIQLFRYDVK